MVVFLVLSKKMAHGLQRLSVSDSAIMGQCLYLCVNWNTFQIEWEAKSAFQL